MVLRPRRSWFAALPLVVSFVVGGLPEASPAVVDAAVAPWTTPTSPPRCTLQQANDGTVAGCVLMAGNGLPEDRGWPAAPFPVPENQTVVPWVNLSLGMKDLTIAKVQSVLKQQGASLTADGQFGYQTLAAVQAYQTAMALPATGVVDEATATALGVQRTTGGTFPPKGWTWNGWGYNGSPALVQYAKLLTSNKARIGRMPAGSLKAFAAALPLFERFYAEIQAKGYVIRNGGTWVFRCTASTRKDCAGLTKYALSNHAFGLASDINTVQNPMVRYYAKGGASACAVPMKTDMPRWVVRTAEKWGLYWGGYGWTSGCQSPSQWRGSVSRDPMHFEFNGTPMQAQAILRRNLGSGTCIDIVNDAGQPVNWCLMKGEVPPAGLRLAVRTGAPAGATAALVDVTTSDATATGGFTAESCDARAATPRPTLSGTTSVGRMTTTTVIAPLDANGRFCIFQSGTFHTAVDVEGFFSPSAAAPDGLLFTPVAPQRTLDTATTTFCTPDGVCTPPSAPPASVPVLNNAASGASPSAVLASVRTTGASTASLTTDTCPALAAPHPRWMIFNGLDAVTMRTSVIRAETTDAGVLFCTRTTKPVHQTVDVTGFFSPAVSGGSGFALAPLGRLADTTGCWTAADGTQHCQEMLGNGGLRVAAPAGTTSLVATITMSGAASQVTVRGGVCGTDPATWPVAGVSLAGGASNSSFAVVPVGPDGIGCLWADGPVHVTVDGVGTFAPTNDLRYVPVTAARVYATKP